MAKSKSANHILAGVITSVLRLPAFFLFENCVFPSEDEICSQFPHKAIGFLLPTLMLLLRKKQLFKLYWNITGYLLLASSCRYVRNDDIDEIKVDNSVILTAFLWCTVTGLLAVYSFQEKDWMAKAMMGNSVTVVTMYIGLPSYITYYIHVITGDFTVWYLLYRFYLSMSGLIKDIYRRINKVFGFYRVAKRILYSIQQKLLVFWLASFAYSAAFPVKETFYVIWNMSWSDLITFLSTCVEECCRTPIGLMATSVAVAHVAPYARLLLEAFLYGFRRTGRHDDGGLDEGIAFLLISIRFGVAEKHHPDTYQDVQRRLFLLKVTSLSVMAIFLETTYEMLDSKILSFSASKKITNHFRAVMTYTVLLVSLCYVVYTVAI